VDEGRGGGSAAGGGPDGLVTVGAVVDDGGGGATGAADGSAVVVAVPAGASWTLATGGASEGLTDSATAADGCDEGDALGVRMRMNPTMAKPMSGSIPAAT